MRLARVRISDSSRPDNVFLPSFALETHLNATAARVLAPIRGAAFGALIIELSAAILGDPMAAAEYALAASSRGPEYPADWKIARCIVSMRSKTAKARRRPRQMPI